MPQGILNATRVFQSTVSKVLEELEAVCMVWIDDLIIWGSLQGELVSKLFEVLGRWHDVGLFAATQEFRVFEPTVKWCGKIYSGQGVEHGPERVSKLGDVGRPELVGDLMKFCKPRVGRGCFCCGMPRS